MCCHTPEPIYIGRNALGLMVKFCRVPPNSSMICENTPFSWLYIFRSDANTTSEIKYGIYVMVCTVRLNLSLRSSLSINASKMGAGKPNTTSSALSTKVLRSKRQK